MRSLQFFAVLLLCTAPGLFAQRMGALWEYAYPYEAEAIRLGGVYVGVARGLTAMHSNTAALGFQQDAQLLFSSGRSQEVWDNEYAAAYDLAGSVHIPDWQTTLGISLDVDDFIWKQRNGTDWGSISSYYTHVQNTRLGIHLARRMNEWLAIGIIVRRYESALEMLSAPWGGGSATATGWDVSLSAHARHAADFIGRPSDEMRYGITIDNVLGTELWYLDERNADPLHQVFRTGGGYFWRPEFGRFLGADILSALLAVDASLQGTKHEFRNWGTVGGAAELRFMEVLMISAGIENVIRLGNRYDNWPEYPVLRYGVGLDIPIGRFIDMGIPFVMQFDYAHTEWNSDAEEKEYWHPEDHPQQVNAFSILVRAGLL